MTFFLKMVSAWINTNVTEHFHHGKQLDDAVKEIIANAIDVDNRPGIAPILLASSTMVFKIMELEEELFQMTFVLVDKLKTIVQPLDNMALD